MSNKSTAVEFLTTCALGVVKDAYAKYAAPGFIHHNQYFKGDGPSLRRAMEEASASSPNKSFEVRQLIEEGNKVVCYSHVVKEDMQIAVVHIFRFVDGKIVELWDVGQQIIPDSPNENGLF